MVRVSKSAASFTLPNPKELKERFRGSLAEMEKVGRRDAEAYKRHVLSDGTFGPLMGRKPEMELPPSLKDFARIRAAKNEWMALKYRAILRHFKAASQNSFDQVCQVLAMWLKEEEICKPEDLLPETIFRKLTHGKKWTDEKGRKISSEGPNRIFAGFQPAEKKYADMVMTMAPYFELAVRVYQSLSPTPSKSLSERMVDLGFNREALSAVGVARLTRQPLSAISAACRFVAARTRYDESMLRSAVSKFYPQRHRTLSKTPRTRKTPLNTE